jgi:hypothetical protein
VSAPFIGPGRERRHRAAAGSGGINAGRFSIKRKGGSGDGRRFGGGSWVVDVPAMEEEGGRRGGRDGSVRWRPIRVAAQSCLTGGRRRPAGPSGPKGFLGWTVLLGRANRVGPNQIKILFEFLFEFWNLARL